jgi:hypothetical protein
MTKIAGLVRKISDHSGYIASVVSPGDAISKVIRNIGFMHGDIGVQMFRAMSRVGSNFERA